MIADVLVPQGTWGGQNRRPLFTYRVPPALAEVLQPGQLVLVPFGPQATQGIVWSAVREEGVADVPEGVELRDLRALLDEAPVLQAHQRALAEWISEYYCVSLTYALSLMLPPKGGGLRLFWRAESSPEGEEAEPDGTLFDVSYTQELTDLLREKGKLDQTAIQRKIGPVRANIALAELLEQNKVEVAPAHLRARRASVVRLAVPFEEAITWREARQQELDTLTLPKAAGLRRQLAVIGLLLTAAPRGAAAGLGTKHWTQTEVRKATKAEKPTFAALQQAGLIVIEEAETPPDTLAGLTISPSGALPLTLAQQQAVERILAAKQAAVFLLHGITGSGKTEVYLQTLAAVLARGQQGIVLVPEIALTPQAVARFAGRFMGRVAVLHSGLTDGERRHEWRRIRAGQADVVIGSRSAIFAPLPRLGLIVIDEEHEGAYQQGDRLPTYHARQVAIELGRLLDIPVVLGSATPSTESYHAAQSGRYVLLELPTRVGQAARTAGATTSNGLPLSAQEAGLPEVTIVDLRAELRAGHTNMLSRLLIQCLREVLTAGDQAILFLNRRGMATHVMCPECGYVALCPRCDIPLTYHATDSAMLCHYCNRHEEPLEICPVCLHSEIRYAGKGTERVEEVVQRLFPQARLLRWDNDTARGRHGHEHLLEAFANRRADILVGTQMIAKGLDIPSVTLVGVVSADTALYLPDYHAGERAFQLLTQVAGRAGRGSTPGRVIFQTFTPEHFCIQAAAEHNYREFYEAEISARRQYGYPPFRRFVKFTFSHKDRYAAQVEATSLCNTLQQVIAERGLPETDVVGPAPAFLERLREEYRWQVIVRGPDLRPLLGEVAPEELPYGWSVDIDPMSTL